MSADLPRQFGPYALLKRLGQGAMGDAHLARPLDAARGVPSPIVVKRLHGELATNATFVARFAHEARIAISVDDPHVAKVYDAGSVGETLYIGMEYVPGWPLSRFMDEVVQSRRHASIASIVDLFAGGLEGLRALHGAVDLETGRPLAAVHRDISPKNLMVGDDGAMRIIDLGLGKSNLQEWKTRTGVVMGSVGYMPPEQVLGEAVDQRADLYAIGVVLYELLSLKQLIKRGALQVMLRESLRPALYPPSRFRSDVPRALDAVVLKAIQPDPADRFQSAAEFLAALRAIVPERASRGGMASLLGELFGGSLIERRDEISALLALPLPEPVSDGEAEEDLRTVVFVQAPGVRPLSDADLRAPTQVVPRNAPPVEPTQVATAVARREVDATLVPTALVSGPPQPRRGVPIWAVAVAMAVTLGAGIAIGGRWLDRAEEALPLAAPAPAPVVIAPVAEPAARAQESLQGPPEGAPRAPEPQRQPQPQPQPEPYPEPARPAHVPRRSTQKAKPAPAPEAPRPPAEVTQESVGRLAQGLLRRASALKGRVPAGTGDVRRIDALRVKISMESGATDLAAAAARLRALGEELSDLERAAP